MGHASLLRGEYRALAGRLGRGPVTMVEPRDTEARRAWQDILEILFTPEDAALAARLPVVPTTAEALTARTGMDAATLRVRLGAMADKGLVLDLPDRRTGATTYMLAPPVVGFFEFSMMRLDDGLPKARLARAYDAYVLHDTAFAEEVAGSTTLIGRALIHEPGAPADLFPEVLDWESASSYVEAADIVSLTNCFCRHSAEHLGTRCEAPLETCMSVGTAADYLIRHGLGRPIGREEGLEVLAQAREAGLVHIADNVREEISYLCNCCACCCHELKSAQAGMSVVQPSGFQPAGDREKCIGCGRCVRACPVQAVSLVPRGRGRGDGDETNKRLLSHVDLERCLGCGVCVDACRHDALRMERRPRPPYVPLNPVEALVRRMLEKGRLADLLVDGAAGRGPAFANAVLGAVLALPPAKRALASEHLHSRFVRYALSRS